MMNDTEGGTQSNAEYTENAYHTKEVPTMLNMPVPTVRTYSQELEKAGYEFLKTKVTGKHQARLYVEKDVTALRYLLSLREKSNIKVSEAVSIVIDKLGAGAIQDIRSNDIPENKGYEKQYNELKEMIQHQNELIKGLYERLDEQEQYINNHITNEQPKQIESEQEQQPEEKAKGFWSKLFKRK